MKIRKLASWTIGVPVLAAVALTTWLGCSGTGIKQQPKADEVIIKRRGNKDLEINLPKDARPQDIRFEVDPNGKIKKATIDKK